MTGFDQQPVSFGELRSSLQDTAVRLDDNRYHQAAQRNEFVDQFRQIGSIFNGCRDEALSLLNDARSFCLQRAPYSSPEDAAHNPVALEVVIDAVDTSGLAALRGSTAVAVVRAMADSTRAKPLTYDEFDVMPAPTFRIGYFLRTVNGDKVSYERFPNKGVRFGIEEIIDPEIARDLMPGREVNVDAGELDKLYEATQIGSAKLAAAQGNYQLHFGYLQHCLDNDELNPGGKARALTYPDVERLTEL